MSSNEKIDLNWEEEAIDVSNDANFIWEIANKLRGVYMPDKYGDVVIPMTIIRRFECALAPTKKKVLEEFKNNPKTPAQKFYKITGYQFYNTSDFTLEELLASETLGGDDGDFMAYINGFSPNVREILEGLEIEAQMKKMDTGGCLYSVIQAFSMLDLSIDKYDSIRMGYIFENLIGRFFQNVDAGQFYTGRDIIKLLVSILISEGCDDIFDDHKVITVCDQACGTGGMLSTAYTYLKHYNPTADVRLFGQEFMPVSYSVGLAEMLIKGQDSSNFRHTDSFKEDCFKNQKMRFVIENPPFGTPWKGDKAKQGQEEAVLKEWKKGFNGRWGAGLPDGGDSQLIFMQSAIDKLDEHNGRAAIISNGSPLANGDTANGSSQIRRWMIENDLIEAIISLPTDLFYNTNIATYVWILSKNKRDDRKGKIQLIDCTSDKFYKKMKKPIGKKRNEFTLKNRNEITKLYSKFEKNEYSKIFENKEFLYREYSIMQPLQRSYGITLERIDEMISRGSLSFLYDVAKVYELENYNTDSKPKDNETEEEKKKRLEKEAKTIKSNKIKLQKFYDNKPIYDSLIERLKNNVSEKIYYSPEEFEQPLSKILFGFDKKVISKILDGLGVMDKNAQIQYKYNKKEKTKEMLFDSETKEFEIVKFSDSIDEHMNNEILPHMPDAHVFFEGTEGENATFMDDHPDNGDDKSNKKIIKIGAEIPFARYFYKYSAPTPSEELLKRLSELDKSVNDRISKLVK